MWRPGPTTPMQLDAFSTVLVDNTTAHTGVPTDEVLAPSTTIVFCNLADELLTPPPARRS